MSDRSNLFDQAAEGRKAGMEQTDENADEWWKDYADLFIWNYCRTHQWMFVDDLWEAGLEEPVSMRALGPRIVAAARHGYIERTDRSRPSVRSHLTHKPIWKSLIYEMQ